MSQNPGRPPCRYSPASAKCRGCPNNSQPYLFQQFSPQPSQFAQPPRHPQPQSIQFSQPPRQFPTPSGQPPFPRNQRPPVPRTHQFSEPQSQFASRPAEHEVHQPTTTWKPSDERVTSGSGGASVWNKNEILGEIQSKIKKGELSKEFGKFGKALQLTKEELVPAMKKIDDLYFKVENSNDKAFLDKFFDDAKPSDEAESTALDILYSLIHPTGRKKYYS